LEKYDDFPENKTLKPAIKKASYMLPRSFAQRINVKICDVGRMEIVVFSTTKRTSFHVNLSRVLSSFAAEQRAENSLLQISQRNAYAFTVGLRIM
jgi:hypothetical protein